MAKALSASNLFQPSAKADGKEKYYNRTGCIFIAVHFSERIDEVSCKWGVLTPSTQLLAKRLIKKSILIGIL